MRRLGDITLDMEPLITELIDDHDLQYADVLGIVYLYLQVHFPGAREIYTEDGTSPVLYYGPQKGVK